MLVCKKNEGVNGGANEEVERASSADCVLLWHKAFILTTSNVYLPFCLVVLEAELINQKEIVLGVKQPKFPISLLLRSPKSQHKPSGQHLLYAAFSFYLWNRFQRNTTAWKSGNCDTSTNYYAWIQTTVESLSEPACNLPILFSVRSGPSEVICTTTTEVRKNSVIWS